MMHQIRKDGKFWRSWTGATPGVEKELKKALNREDGFEYSKVAFGDYPEGEDVSHFNLDTGERIVPLPTVELSEKDRWNQELSTLKAQCIELDRASDRSVRAILCKTDTPEDKIYLQKIESDILIKRARIQELNNLIEQEISEQ